MQLIKVFSHPRSGTHFLEAFLASNFYPGEDLSVAPIEWGHWAHRQSKKEGNPLGKLFGNHFFPPQKPLAEPSIYIYRDGHAVALSCWKTPGFKHPDIENISFSDYLRTPIDWRGSPGRKTDNPQQTIVEHWVEHVSAWQSFNDPNLLIIRHEELASNPAAIAQKIATTFDMTLPQSIKAVDKPVGLLPNAANNQAWQKHFSLRDRLYYQRTKLQAQLKYRR